MKVEEEDLGEDPRPVSSTEVHTNNLLTGSPKNGQIVGVHIIGDSACELINVGALMVSSQQTVFDVLRTVFPDVTLHELYAKAGALAKIKLSGATNVVSAVAWTRLNSSIEKTIALEDADPHAYEKDDADQIIWSDYLIRMSSGGCDNLPLEFDTAAAIARAARKSKGLPRLDRNIVILEEMFRQFDRDKSQELDCEELQQMFNESFNLDLTEGEVRDMVKEIDADGNGQISLKEFRTVAKRSLIWGREGTVEEEDEEDESGSSSSGDVRKGDFSELAEICGIIPPSGSRTKEANETEKADETEKANETEELTK